MSVNYTYEVISADENRNKVVLRYTVVGKPPVDVSTLPPATGQTLDELARMNFPGYLLDPPTFETVVIGIEGTGGTAPLPEVVSAVSFFTFYGYFTGPERTALIAATQTDVATKRYYDEMWMLDLVSTALPQTTQLLDQLVTLGVITGARKIAILDVLP